MTKGAKVEELANSKLPMIDTFISLVTKPKRQVDQGRQSTSLPLGGERKTKEG